MVKVRERNPKLEKEARFVVDLTIPKEGNLVIPKDFASFLQSNIKLNGTKGNLGSDLTVTVQGGRVTVTTTRQIAKRYLKYLTKKYLKRNEILEYFRVLATAKNTYTVRYMKKRLEEDEEEA